MANISVDNPPTITVDGRTIICEQGKSVLENLENANIDVSFHCREGFCGVCRTQLLSGKVEYTLDPLAFIDDDEILSCCTRPLTDIEIKVSF